MRIIEGTVEEIVEYQRRTGAPADTTPTSEPDGDEPPAVVTVDEDDDSADAWFYVHKHVHTRATDPATNRRVLRLLEELPEGTLVEIGNSERTSDGWSNYLMVRDNGPQKYGAVTYIDPATGRLTFRLRPGDIEDLGIDGVIERDVAAKQKYALRYFLDADDKLEGAITLIERALELVRD